MMPESGVRDPRQLVATSAMSSCQWAIVAVMVGLNALDGFDALAISFAAPGILQHWGITREALGIVMSMELFGMTIGSLMLGGVADVAGRRSTILGCLLCMTGGMVAAAAAPSIVILSLGRILTGFGIGGMLTATNASVAEAANTRRRALAVVLMAAGFPIGSVIGGTVSVYLLRSFAWTSVFAFGAACSAAFIPLVLWLAPDSIEFELHKRRPDALARINHLLRRMGHRGVTALPPVTNPDLDRWVPIKSAFGRRYRWTTILLALAYFANITTFHFVFKWTAQAVVDLGFSASEAASVLVWASAGGLAGCAVFGLLSSRMSPMLLTIGAGLLAALAVALFGTIGPSLPLLSGGAMLAGLSTNATVVGLYAMIAALFPTGLRASATGFIIGVGRGGAVVAPAIAGFLLSAGYSFGWVAVLMGLGSAGCAAAILALHVITRRPAADAGVLLGGQARAVE